MLLPVALTSLLNTFAISPDLCADVYLDPAGEPYSDAWGQTLPRYCQWTGPDAPVLDSDVCCTIDGDGAHCSVPDVNGRCALGFKMYCEYGAVVGEGVTCYQPFPNACDHGVCASGVDAPSETQGDLACCVEQSCENISVHQIWDCKDSGGVFFYCYDGVTNEDGTMECFDDHASN